MPRNYREIAGFEDKVIGGLAADEKEAFDPFVPSVTRNGDTKNTENGTSVPFDPFVTEHGNTKTDSEWGEPIPFDIPPQPPEFPTDALPAAVADYVEALAVSTQTAPEMAGSLALGVLATAFQRRYTVEITSDWLEPTNLFIVAIAAPGERKSAVLSSMLRPIYEYEQTRHEEEAEALEQNRTEKELLQGKLQALKSAAVKKPGQYEEYREKALELSAELANFRDLYPLRLLVDDCTPEQLIKMLDEQGGSLALASAEGGVFDVLANGRYESSGALDVYLKAHSGDVIRVDRIGRAGNKIMNPHLTVMLTVQPQVIRGLMANPAFRGRGLCGRFLYAVCPSLVGHRDIEPPTIPPAVKERYNEFIERILDCGGNGVIRLGADADALRKDFQRMIESRLNDELAGMEDFGGKLVGQTMRLAGLLHAAESLTDPTEEPIPAERMEAAIRLAWYYYGSSRLAYQEMDGADRGEADARYILRRFIESGEDVLTQRELLRKCKGRFKRADELQEAVNTLIEMNYLKESIEQTGGRPTKKLILNPVTKGTKGTKGR